MRAIEIAYQLNWKKLWLETDSSMVVAAFTNPSVPVTWNLRNMWNNVLNLLTNMNCIVTHIHRERNQVVDILASRGLSYPFLSHWNAAPLFIIRDSLVKNQLRLSNFRFCTY
jgi:ribonuclease HI